jgi:hypothetical protein
MAIFVNVGLAKLLAAGTPVLKVGKVNNESIQNAEDVGQGTVTCRCKKSASDTIHESLTYMSL